MSTINIALAGADGRMGRACIETLATFEDHALRLTLPLVPKDSPYLGTDSGVLAGIEKNGIVCTDDLNQNDFDVLIDFSVRNAVTTHIKFCQQHKRAALVCVTGLEAIQTAAIADAATEIAILNASNTSIGINLISHIASQLARNLPNSDVEIAETHHRDKKDAPSGTALDLGKAIARARNMDFETCAIYDRTNRSKARSIGDIGFSVTRGGDAVGEHRVVFMQAGEQVEIIHRASNRSIFARGALTAAQWLYKKPKGLYGMEDVLGLS